MRQIVLRLMGLHNVDGVLRLLNRVVSDLDAVRARMQKEVEVQEQRAQDAIAIADAAKAESERARRVLSRIKELTD